MGHHVVLFVQQTAQPDGPFLQQWLDAGIFSNYGDLKKNVHKTFAHKANLYLF